MNLKHIMRNGEYLGYCPVKGYLYSLFSCFDDKGNALYRIYSIKNNKIEKLIEFSATKGGENNED